MLIWIKNGGETPENLNVKINFALAALLIIGFFISTILNPILFYFHW